MLKPTHIQELTALITHYIKEKQLIPLGKQLHVSLDVRSAPEIPVVLVTSTTSVTADVNLVDIGLNARVLRVLTNGCGMKVVADVLNVVSKEGSTDVLLRYRNFGRTALLHLIDCLKDKGFNLGPEWGK